jgi:hypothetical protein
VMIEAIVLATMIGCCFFCTTCLFEMPAPFPTVVSSQTESNYGDPLNRPVRTASF